jgi:hypothetical protein
VVSGTQAAPSITVNGSGFGADVSALGTAYANPSDCGGSFTGSDYNNNFIFDNVTQDWSAGRGTGQLGDNCIGVIISSYSNTQIVFTLGSNFSIFSYPMKAGDAFTMTVLGTVFNGSVPVIVPATIPPAGATVTQGQRAAWTFTVANPYDVTMSSLSASFSVLANGEAPVNADFASMPGCGLDEGGSPYCPLADLAPHTSTTVSLIVFSTGLDVGATIDGDVRVDSNIASSATGILGTVTVGGCGSACTTGAATPGDPVSSQSGPTTDAHPTKQTVTLPAGDGPPVAVTLKSVNPGPSTSASDKQLCPTTGNKCSGQISVIGGDFSKYNDRAHPVKIQVVMHWSKQPIPKGRMLMTKLVGPPITLPTCVKKNNLYNTPCAKPEVVSGSLATHNLITVDVILFVGTDPHIGRRASTVPDAPTAIKAVAGKKSATVTWKAPIVTNGAITGYLLTPHLGKTAKPIISVKGTGTKKVVSGLTTGKSYTFTLQAKNAHGISFASIASKAVKIK